MGRVVRHEVVALRCELRSCAARYELEPFSIFAEPEMQRTQMEHAVSRGWVLVLTPRLRSYCTLHASSALMCSCRTNPDRVHLCVRHDSDAAALIWSEGHLGAGASVGVGAGPRQDYAPGDSNGACDAA